MHLNEHNVPKVKNRILLNIMKDLKAINYYFQYFYYREADIYSDAILQRYKL